MNIFLSVVIPSYNETENLKRGVLDEVNSYLQKQKYSWEIIVSDDGSPQEESRKLAKSYCDSHKGFVFLENEHAGKPFALWSGIQKTSGEIILITDMDQSAPLKELEKLLPWYQENFDLVIGSRGTKRKNFSLFRLLASTIFRIFRQSLILPKIVDTQAGFKTFKRTVAIDIFPRLQVIQKGRQPAVGWKVGAWDAELLYIADKYGYKIKEVPVLWEDQDISTGKKGTGKFVQESLEMLEQIFRVRLNDFRGYYRK